MILFGRREGVDIVRSIKKGGRNMKNWFNVMLAGPVVLPIIAFAQEGHSFTVKLV
jgi:hypothetical protein